MVVGYEKVDVWSIRPHTVLDIPASPLYMLPKTHTTNMGTCQPHHRPGDLIKHLGLITSRLGHFVASGALSQYCHLAADALYRTEVPCPGTPLGDGPTLYMPPIWMKGLWPFSLRFDTVTCLFLKATCDIARKKCDKT